MTRGNLKIFTKQAAALKDDLIPISVYFSPRCWTVYIVLIFGTYRGLECTSSSTKSTPYTSFYNTSSLSSERVGEQTYF